MQGCLQNVWSSCSEGVATFHIRASHLNMRLKGILNAALCCFVCGLVTTDTMERTVARHIMKTLSQCAVQLDCRQTQLGESCYLHRNITGKGRHLKLNSHQLRHTFQASHEDTSSKSNKDPVIVPSAPKRHCSCRLPGYGMVDRQTKYLFTISNQVHNESVYLHEPSNLTKKVKLDLHFNGQPFYLFPVINRCRFLWMPRKDQQYNSMCFNGKNKTVIFNGFVRCGYHDHLRGLHFFWEHHANSTTLKVFDEDKYQSTILRTEQFVECECFSGDPESQTIVYCTTQDKGVFKRYTLHTIHYRNLDRIKHRKAVAFSSMFVYTAVVSEDALVFQSGWDTVYLYNITDDRKTTVGQCPFRSITFSPIGVWNGQVFIKCTKTNAEYYYFYTLGGRKTTEMKTEIGTLLAVGVA